MKWLIVIIEGQPKTMLSSKKSSKILIKSKIKLNSSELKYMVFKMAIKRIKTMGSTKLETYEFLIIWIR